MIKETDDNPEGWKVVSETPDKEQFLVHNNDDHWSTEWTSRSIGEGKKLGAVPDFLKELRNEYHGPDFDYFASFDNSNEEADESDYHYKTPLDAHDFLSHHQNADSIELSNKHEWSVKPGALSELQRNEADLDNVWEKVNGTEQKADKGRKQTSLTISNIPDSNKPKSDVKSHENQLPRTKIGTNDSDKTEIETKITEIMNLLKKVTKTSSENQKLIFQGPNNVSKETGSKALSKAGGKETIINTHTNKLTNKEVNSNEQPISEVSTSINNTSSGRNSRDSTDDKNGNIQKATEANTKDKPGLDEPNYDEEQTMPLEKIVKDLVSGVQGILQLKNGSPHPVKGSWTLSYRVNSTKTGGQFHNITYLEANNMLLKFNNSDDNQEDWSLVFHRGSSDASSKNNEHASSNENLPPSSDETGNSTNLENALSQHKAIFKMISDLRSNGNNPVSPNNTQVPKERKSVKGKRDSFHDTENVNMHESKQDTNEAIIPADEGWSVFKVNTAHSKNQEKSDKMETKTNTENPPNLMLPTDYGWSVFSVDKSSNEDPKGKSEQNSTIPSETVWTVLQLNDTRSSNIGEGVILLSSKEGWVHSPKNASETQILTGKYNVKFEPANVVTVSEPAEKFQTKKSSPDKNPDVNKKLLADSNEDDGNSNMLEDEAEEISRDIKKGDAVNVSDKKNNGKSKVISLQPGEQTDAKLFADRNGEERVEKVMETIRKAGLDAPKNAVIDKWNSTVVKVEPQNTDRQKVVDNFFARRSEAEMAKIGNDTKKNDNKTVSEESLQASLHESLQSAMSGIVKVFNNQVDGHSVMAVKGTLKQPTEKQQEAMADNQVELTNVTWTPWSQWSSCSVSCGRGWITRRRFCLTVTRKCEGRAIEMKFCHKKPCPGKYYKLHNCWEFKLEVGSPRWPFRPYIV